MAPDVLGNAGELPSWQAHSETNDVTRRNADVSLSCDVPCAEPSAKHYSRGELLGLYSGCRGVAREG